MLAIKRLIAATPCRTIGGSFPRGEAMLFEPVTVGPLTLANRVVMAPMTRCRADHRDAVPNELMVEYYRQRARAGLILSEGVPVSDNARGYLNTAALWNEAQAAGWQRVNDAVHGAGGRIFAQLWHCGRIAHSRLHADGSLPVGASAIAARAEAKVPGPDGIVVLPCETPRVLATDEIAGIVADFARSAELARLAGFDGVEIHGANGYLLDQFRCPFVNDRSDRYGGSLENRYRLLLEVVDAVCAVWEPGRVCVRQSPRGIANDMQPDPDPLHTYPYIARELDRRDIGLLHIFDQSAHWIHEDDPLLPALRAAYRGALMVCGGFDRDKAEAVLARGADLVAFGKAFISNPDLIERLRRREELNPWNVKTFYAPGAAGYIDYPSLAAR
jgi:2,4-dienoyl-CoA reductase-like NADH-dependent reductase (Old Yellow Enzyme family)